MLPELLQRIALPVPCNVHGFGFLERHNISVLSMLIFSRIQQKTDQVHMEVPIQKMQTVQNCPQKIKWLILQLLTVTPSSTRL